MRNDIKRGVMKSIIAMSDLMNYHRITKKAHNCKSFRFKRCKTFPDED